jgi:hypothetical protein
MQFFFPDADDSYLPLPAVSPTQVVPSSIQIYTFIYILYISLSSAQLQVPDPPSSHTVMTAAALLLLQDSTQTKQNLRNKISGAS